MGKCDLMCRHPGLKLVLIEVQTRSQFWYISAGTSAVQSALSWAHWPSRRACPSPSFRQVEAPSLLATEVPISRRMGSQTPVCFCPARRTARPPASSGPSQSVGETALGRRASSCLPATPWRDGHQAPHKAEARSQGLCDGQVAVVRTVQLILGRTHDDLTSRTSPSAISWKARRDTHRLF